MAQLLADVPPQRLPGLLATVKRIAQENGVK